MEKKSEKRKCGSLSKLLGLFFLIPALFFSCERDVEINLGETFDPGTEYSIDVVAKLGKFVEGQNGGSPVFVIEDFAQDAPQPKITANPSKVKEKGKSLVTISDIPGNLVIDGGNTKASASGSVPALQKKSETQYQLTAGRGPNTVVVVFINPSDILRLPSAYDNTLLTADIAKGEFTESPLATTYSGSDTPSDVGVGTSRNNFWKGSVSYSGYNDAASPKFDFTPFPNNTEADAVWEQVGGGLLQYEDKEFFRVKATVIPQVKVLFENISDIYVDYQNLPVYGTGKTVREMYDLATTKDFYFEFERRAAVVDARLESVIIMPSTPVVFNFNDEAVPSNLVPVKTLPVFDVPSGTLNLEVHAATLDPNATLIIDNNSGSNQNFVPNVASNTIDIASGANTVTFVIRVRSESGAEARYTFVGMLSAPKYATNATGGSTYFLEEFDPSKPAGSAPEKIYEVHYFYISSRDSIALGDQLSASLVFADSSKKPVKAEVLVVGGGGGGGSTYQSGGGGAGGVIHYKDYTLPEGLNFSVKVGNGGKAELTGDSSHVNGYGSTPTGTAVTGQNGGNSVFGTGSNRLEAPGGGGGANSMDNYNWVWTAMGTRGGSNGGLYWRASTYNAENDAVAPFFYDGAERSPDNLLHPSLASIRQLQKNNVLSWNATDFEVEHPGKAFGNPSGSAGFNCTNNGAGGGGAATMGIRQGWGNGIGDAGGQGLMFNTSGVWRWYAGGGQGGARSGGLNDFPGSGGSSGYSAAPQTGSGGSGGGGSGGSGVVIVKWEYKK